MSTPREEILGRIRAALRDVPPDERSEDVPVPRTFRGAGGIQGEGPTSEAPTGEAPTGEAPTGEALIDRFSERVRDYHAEVQRIAPAELGAAVSRACERLGLRRVVVPPGLPATWRPVEAEVVEDHGLSARALDAVDGVLTGCAVAIAETGTIILDGQHLCGRRLITLVPDHHICVVAADQVVELVPEAIARLATPVASARVPVTMISGPSASSDIELDRVEGVHGPRHLLVLIH